MDTPTKSYRDACIQTSPIRPPRNEDVRDCLADKSEARRLQNHQQAQAILGEPLACNDTPLARMYHFVRVEGAQAAPKKTWLPSQPSSSRATFKFLDRRRIVSLPEQCTTPGKSREETYEHKSNTRCVSMPLYLRSRLPMDDPDAALIEYDDASGESCYFSTTPSMTDSSPPKPIPALHGPASLPYARCPSGADGIIIAAPSELPNLVWGLNELPSKRNTSSANIEVHFGSIAKEELKAGHRRNTIHHDFEEETYGTPLPPAYESPVLEDGSMLPFYDQAIVSMGDFTQRDHSNATLYFSSMDPLTEQSQRPRGLEEETLHVFNESLNAPNSHRMPRASRSLDANATPFTPHSAYISPRDSSSVLQPHLWNGDHNRLRWSHGLRIMPEAPKISISSMALDLPDLLGNMQLCEPVQNDRTTLNSCIQGDMRAHNHGTPITLAPGPQFQVGLLPSMPISLHDLAVPSLQNVSPPLLLQPKAHPQQKSSNKTSFELHTARNLPQSISNDRGTFERVRYPRSIPLQRLLHHRLASVPEEVTTTYNSEVSDDRRRVSESTATIKKPRPHKIECHTGPSSPNKVDVDDVHRDAIASPQSNGRSKPKWKVSKQSNTRKRRNLASVEFGRPKSPEGRKFMTSKNNDNGSRSTLKEGNLTHTRKN